LVLSLRALSKELGSRSSLSGFALSLAARAEDVMPGETITDQLSFLQVLHISLQSEIERLARELIDTQSKLTAYEQARERLQQEVTLARDTHQELSKKAQEASQANGKDASAKIAAQARCQNEPSSPQIAINAFINAALGGMLSTVHVTGSPLLIKNPRPHDP